MRLSIILLGIILLLLFVVGWQYWETEGALLLLVIVAIGYIFIRMLHASLGKGANVGWVEVFLYAFAVAFLALAADYHYTIELGISTLVLIGVVFVVLVIVMSSELIRKLLKWIGRKLFPGRG